jgi:hypothetical protein
MTSQQMEDEDEYLMELFEQSPPKAKA